MKLYNTLTKQKEEFIPLKNDSVSFYHCGPTVYWTQHIGNLRAVVMADVIRRSLEFAGYNVSYIRNYTDVGHLTGDNEGDADHGEDRMEKASKRENTQPEEIAQKYINQFEQDIKALNIKPATESPKATDHITEMQNMISVLLDKGFAYTTPLAIYFDISKAKDYTQLSGQDLNKNLTDAGHGDVIDDEKRNPQDFALWFFKAGTHKHALQTWSSPFKSTLTENGEGFPGWHIECSAMSKKYLGTTLDIHMGGIEHIPIHHTNEIAQSESANDAKFSNMWLHNEHLLFDGSKMSKSEGTAYSLSEIIDKGFSALDLRYFMLQAHYRSKQNFTWEALSAARNGLQNLYKDIQNLKDEPSIHDIKSHPLYIQFKESLEDDVNTPQALSTISLVLKSNLSDGDKRSMLLSFDKVLGLDLEKNSKSQTLNTDSLPDNIQDLIKKREESRKNKDWDKSDTIRNQLKDLGYIVNDDSNGQQLIEKI